MKVSKVIVLLGGLLGIAAFFLPLVAVKDSGFRGTISAFQIVKGVEDVRDLVDNAPGKVDMTPEDLAKAKQQANEALSGVKTIVLAIFAPTVLMILIGGVATARGKFGRLGGIGAFLLGAVGMFIWAALNAGANEAATEHGDSVKGVGMYLLMITAACGLIGGLLALIKPDRGDVQVAMPQR